MNDNGMEWNGMEAWKDGMDGMEWKEWKEWRNGRNGMDEWNMEWTGMDNGMEWNGMEWTGMDTNRTSRSSMVNADRPHQRCWLA